MPPARFRGLRRSQGDGGMHDFIRDWRRWSAAERTVAAALALLAVALPALLAVANGP
jgi:hypothetical protein